MKALSIRQPWAGMIADGTKTIETRTWQTNYRGDILLCSSKNYNKKELEAIRNIYIKEQGFAPVFLETTGSALCVAELYDVTPMTEADADEACCDVYEGAYSWRLRNIRPITPFPVFGKLSLFEVDYSC